LVKNETAEDIKKAIADLNIRLRLPVILKYYTGLTDRQIADTLRCPVTEISEGDYPFC
jgi:DNA-directed RNA polymerase specialized sigma24 family protein